MLPGPRSAISAWRAPSQFRAMLASSFCESRKRNRFVELSRIFAAAVMIFSNMQESSGSLPSKTESARFWNVCAYRCISGLPLQWSSIWSMARKTELLSTTWISLVILPSASPAAAASAVTCLCSAAKEAWLACSASKLRSALSQRVRSARSSARSSPVPSILSSRRRRSAAAGSTGAVDIVVTPAAAGVAAPPAGVVVPPAGAVVPPALLPPANLSCCRVMSQT